MNKTDFEMPSAQRASAIVVPENLEAHCPRSASDQAAYEVAEYVIKLRTAVTELAGYSTISELRDAVEAETADLVKELRQETRTTGTR